MSKFVKNPYKEQWKDLDVNEIIDTTVLTLKAMARIEDKDIVDEAYEDLDILLKEYMIMARFKNDDLIEMISLRELTPEFMELFQDDLDLYGGEIIDGYVIKELVHEDYFLDNYRAKGDDNNNKWLR